jgi:hypothetical protein
MDENEDSIGASITTLCSNDCEFRFDGICDDTRGSGYCELGTDCQVIYELSN